MLGLSMGGLNTGVTAEVKGENFRARVDYYTATFYDGETAFGEDTFQRQQIILKGYSVVRPEDPTGAGVEFQGWMTEAQGDVTFDFARAIQGKTAIYASWKDKESDNDIPGESDSSGNGNNNNSYDISDSNLAESGAVNKAATNDKEPKTGDTSHMEIYATIAMIAGLLYLLLYFADRERGLTEEEKTVY